MIDNYHLPRENASYHIIILHGHLWGGIFQMLGIRERQVAGGNGRGPSGRKESQPSAWRSGYRIRNVRITTYVEVNPLRMEYLVSSATLLVFNLSMIFWRWVSTVLTLICRLSEILAEVLPSAMSCSTSRSRGDSI